MSWCLLGAASLCAMLAPTFLSLTSSSLWAILEAYLCFYWATPCSTTWSGSKALGGTNSIDSPVCSRRLSAEWIPCVSHPWSTCLLDRGEFICRHWWLSEPVQTLIKWWCSCLVQGSWPSFGCSFFQSGQKVRLVIFLKNLLNTLSLQLSTASSFDPMSAT